jgi:ribonuclease G
METNTLILETKGREKRWALLKDQKVVEWSTHQPEHISIVGNIYLATIISVQKGLNAAFVDIGEGKNAFLPADEIPFEKTTEVSLKKKINQLVTVGEKRIVQVKKDHTESKGAMLTCKVEFPSQYLVYMPNGQYKAISKKIADQSIRNKLKQYMKENLSSEEGLIFRTESKEATIDQIDSTINRLRAQATALYERFNKEKSPFCLKRVIPYIKEVEHILERQIQGEVICDDHELLTRIKKDSSWSYEYYQGKSSLFSFYHLDDLTEKSLKRFIWLKSGGYLVIDSTEAMTVIDVNSGKFTGKSSYSMTVLETNKEAAQEVMNQLRLRDISGIIYIDFIDMDSEDKRNQILTIVKQRATEDQTRTSPLGFTKLGVLELTRKKTKPALSERLTKSCSVCSGTGRVLSAETVAYHLERELWDFAHVEQEAVLVEATRDVIHVFSGHKDEHLKRLEKVWNKRIYFQLISSSSPTFRISQFGTIQEISTRESLK